MKFSFTYKTKFLHSIGIYRSHLPDRVGIFIHKMMAQHHGDFEKLTAANIPVKNTLHSGKAGVFLLEQTDVPLYYFKYLLTTFSQIYHIGMCF